MGADIMFDDIVYKVNQSAIIMRGNPLKWESTCEATSWPVNQSSFILIRSVKRTLQPQFTALVQIGNNNPAQVALLGNFINAFIKKLQSLLGSIVSKVQSTITTDK